MKKKKTVAVLFSFALLMAGQAFATTHMALAQIKIGVVDLQKALEGSAAGKEAYKLLKSDYEQKQEKIRQRQDALQKMRTELDSKGSVLKDMVRRDKEEEYQKSLVDLRRFVSDSNQEMQRRERDLAAKILAELMEIAKKIGEEEGYTLVLERREGVIYNAASINLTDKVIKRYDQANK